MLTVHGRATSLNVQAVMWTIAELGLAHERRDVGLNFGGTDTPEYLAMNPNGLVPVLQDEHDGLVEVRIVQHGAGHEQRPLRDRRRREFGPRQSRNRLQDGQESREQDARHGSLFTSDHEESGHSTCQ